MMSVKKNKKYLKNYDDPELSPEEKYGKETLVGLCMKALKGEGKLPWDVSFWDCYHILWEYERKNGSPIKCDWGHGVFSCVACLNFCYPVGKCNHHGLKR